MRPSPEYIEHKFNEFNLLIFNGKLPLPPIKMSRARTFMGRLEYKREKTYLGKYRYSDFVIRISTFYDLPEEEIEDTLIHEMIHYHICFHQMQDTSAHGKLFRRMMNDINNSFGRHITISHKRSEQEMNQDTRTRSHFICIVWLNSGKVGIVIPTKTRIFNTWKIIPQFREVIRYKWVHSSDAFFNRFPRAMTPKFYIVEECLLEEHLKDAVELENTGHIIRPKK